MSDPNEPPRPGGQSDGSGDGSGDAPAPPPPPPPAGDSPYGAPGGAGDSPYGAPGGAGGYGDGGYGAPPPPPPGENPYGQPPGPGAYSPGDAIGYGWNKFKASPSTLLVPMILVWLVLVVAAVLLEILVYSTLLSTHDCTKVVLGNQVAAQCSPSFVTQLFGTALISAILIVVFNLAAAGLYKGATNVTDGKPFSVGQMFDGWDKAQVVIAALIIARRHGDRVLPLLHPRPHRRVPDDVHHPVRGGQADEGRRRDQGEHQAGHRQPRSDHPVLPAGGRVHPRRRLPVSAWDSWWPPRSS